MIKKIFGSGARVKLLQQFLLYPNEEFFIRELTRILDEQINSLRRELENLESIGLLKSHERNRKKYYQINPHFVLLPELASIIRKTQDGNASILKKINKLGSIDLLILTGKFIGKQDHETDILIIGDAKKDDLESFVSSNFPDKKIKYTLMNKEDFLYRVTLKDKFVKNIFADSASIVLKNKLKKDTQELLVF